MKPRRNIKFFDDFENFGEIKSRRSGGRAFIDINLFFEPNKPLKEVMKRCSAIEEDIKAALPNAVITVVPSVAAETADAGQV